VKPAPGPRGLFVTGTDTGVGKTGVAAALLRAARRRGLRPVPFKPVETGCDPEPLDARLLAQAAGWTGPLTDVCPHPLRLPAAPALAARAEDVRLDIEALAAQGLALAARGDFLVVEGAGGLLVPYAAGATTVDLALRLGLPVVVVARTALGTINHTALTVREARRSGLEIAGVILNKTTPTADPHEPANAELIRSLIGLAPLGSLPYLSADARADPDRLADALAGAIDPRALARLLSLPS
jgi:dethiobiotin synthetase